MVESVLIIFGVLLQLLLLHSIYPKNQEEDNVSNIRNIAQDSRNWDQGIEKPSEQEVIYSLNPKKKAQKKA